MEVIKHQTQSVQTLAGVSQHTSHEMEYLPMTSVIVQKRSLSLPFPGHSYTLFSTVPWPSPAETYQELQVIQAVIKPGESAPISEHGREISGYDTYLGTVL